MRRNLIFLVPRRTMLHSPLEHCGASTMTHFFRDILRQPAELQRTLEYLSGAGRGALEAAAATLHAARHVYLTGIGSSWHAGLNVSALFQGGGRPVYLVDAAEMVQFAAIPAGSVLIVISRSGRSVEIVQLLGKARESGATVIGITNAADGALAREAQIAIVVPVAMDHAISVNTYTTLALAAGMLANSVVEGAASSLQGPFLRQDELKPNSDRGSMSDLKVRPPDDVGLGVSPFGGLAGAGTESLNLTGRTARSGCPTVLLAESLRSAFAAAGRAIPGWQGQIENARWLALGCTTYFLARGSSLGSAYEARLMWEEGVKSPAAAMGAASFRHGPQEIVQKDMRFGIWIDGEKMREQDLALARDLRTLGARVMLIGQRLPEDAAELVFQLPEISSEWQFLIDIIPAQLVAERLARLSGVDPDTFRLCSFVVEDDAGLLPKEVPRNKGTA
jgi:fructoselysine-6-P-deglycase FrlB-like protein